MFILLLPALSWYRCIQFCILFLCIFLRCDSVLFRKQSLCLHHSPCQSFTSPAWSRVGSDSFFSSKHMCTQWAVSHLMALHRNLYVGSWLCFVADAQCPSVEDSLCLSQDLCCSECFKSFASESKWSMFFSLPPSLANFVSIIYCGKAMPNKQSLHLVLRLIFILKCYRSELQFICEKFAHLSLTTLPLVFALCVKIHF